jgi:hypothetical protein
MPRNKSERSPGLIELTSNRRINQYITDWYASVSSPWDWPSALKHELWVKSSASLAELTSGDLKAWDELSTDGETPTGQQLRKLCRAAQSK